MIRTTLLLAAGAAGLAAAVPASAQVPYQPYAQPTYPYPQQGYPQQGYPQGQDGISQIIGQLLGNRYQANDRLAVERCATAAMVRANSQYRNNQYGQGYGNQGYGNQGYGNQGYGNQGNYRGQMRVTAITDVRRRNNGVRVSGLLDSRYGGPRPPYGNAYGQQGQGYPGQGYQDPRYAAQADLTFRCNVDYRGAVTDVRIGRNTANYGRGY